MVYPNGDQINVGPGTSYRTHWEEKGSQASKPEWNLNYGRIRAVVEKGGPRTNLKIKTRTAIMGVRGTDFYIADRGPEPSTEVSILRGSVQLQPAEKNAPPVTVEKGFSAAVLSSEAKTAEVRKTTQEQLKSIQKSSSIESHAPASIKPSPELQALEMKAAQTVLKDIQHSDPDLYASLKGSSSETQQFTAQELNQASVQEVLKTAPKAPVHPKQTYDDLNQSQKENAYDRYFRPYEE